MFDRREWKLNSGMRSLVTMARRWQVCPESVVSLVRIMHLAGGGGTSEQFIHAFNHRIVGSALGINRVSTKHHQSICPEIFVKSARGY